MPVSYRKSQMVFQGFPFDHFFGVVPFKRERVSRLRTFVFNFRNIWKGFWHNQFLLGAKRVSTPHLASLKTRRDSSGMSLIVQPKEKTESLRVIPRTIADDV